MKQRKKIRPKSIDQCVVDTFYRYVDSASMGQNADATPTEDPVLENQEDSQVVVSDILIDNICLF